VFVCMCMCVCVCVRVYPPVVTGKGITSIYILFYYHRKHDV